MWTSVHLAQLHAASATKSAPSASGPAARRQEGTPARSTGGMSAPSYLCEGDIVRNIGMFASVAT